MSIISIVRNCNPSSCLQQLLRDQLLGTHEDDNMDKATNQTTADNRKKDSGKRREEMVKQIQ